MRIAFLFSGQGSQFSGMMKDIFEYSQAARKIFQIADEKLNRKISDICFNGTKEDLNLTHNTQPCVLAADLAAHAAIVDAGIKPEAVAGFSLGEYAALVASGVIRIEEVFPLVQKRADYMQEAVPVGKGGMAAVFKLSADDVQALCNEVDGYVIPANYNCPGQIVVSGEAEAVDRLCELAKGKKIRTAKLAVSAPFHCEMMVTAARNLKNPLSKTIFLKPSVPVYMNVDAKIETEPEIIRKKLILQAKSPVQWEQTLRNMADAGIDTFIELGPGKTITNFVKKTFGDKVRFYNVTDNESLNTTIETLSNF